MSFGCFLSGCRSSGVGDGGSRDARLMAATPFNFLPTATNMVQSSLINPPLVQPIFNSSPISLDLKPKMDDLGDLILENFDPGMIGSVKEDEYESRSGSDNLEGVSGDDGDALVNKSLGKKKYHRHSPYQIQELEASFKANPHPDEKARLELGKLLRLDNRQVKFWFQNRRTQMKTQLERHENMILKQENDKLRMENYAMKEAMRNPICDCCGGPAILGELSSEQQQLKFENARLRDDLNRVCALSNKFLGRPVSSLSGSFSSVTPPSSNLELAVGSNGFAGCLSSVDAPLSTGHNFGNGFNALHMVPLTRPEMNINGVPMPIDKSMFVELALLAMDELLKMAQANDSLWFTSFDGVGEALNHEQYVRIFPSSIGMKPNGFVTEATRAKGTVLTNSADFVDSLMDTNRWAEMLPCLIGRASTTDVIFSGSNGTKDGALQLLYAEHQVLSPLVPVREVKFLRFCKKHAEGIWAVADVSVDSEGSNSNNLMNCRRLPSGCIVQDMPNGCSQVTWIEHMEYNESVVHHLYQPLLRSGMSFSAQKWLATIQRQYESQAVIIPPCSPVENHSGITAPNGRGNMLKLAWRMTRDFCSAVCATVHKWDMIQAGNVGENVRLMIRQSNKPGEPPGIVLSAATSVWMPISQQRVFNFLRNEQLRAQWDVLSHGAPMERVACIANDNDCGNTISLLHASGKGGTANQSNILILQETSSDASGSFMAYAAIDARALRGVMNGEDPSSVVCLASGFAIHPDCFPRSPGLENGSATTAKEGSSGGAGSLLTVVFQILVNTPPQGKLTMESVDTVNTLMSRTLQGIKGSLNCS